MGHVGCMNHQVGREIVCYQVNKQVGSGSKKSVEPTKGVTKNNRLLISERSSAHRTSVGHGNRMTTDFSQLGNFFPMWWWLAQLKDNGMGKLGPVVPDWLIVL